MSAKPTVVVRVVGPPFAGVIQQTGLAPDPSVLLEVFSDSSITFYSGKVEYGQGIRNGFARMISAAFDTSIENVNIVLADTARVPFDRGTTGSASTRTVGVQLLRATEAAKNELKARIANGSDNAASRSTSVVEISGEDDAGEQLVEALTIHNGSARVDGAERVIGATVYAHDFTLENTAYGRIIRPPSVGAILARLDVSRAEQVPGFVCLVQIDGLIGVVAESKDAVDNVASFIRARWNEQDDDVSDWNLPAVLKDRGNEPVLLRDDGDTVDAFAKADRVVSGVYYVPYVANAQMEPSAATAKWNEDGSLTVWCANRGPFTERSYLADRLGMEAEDIRVIVQEVGGSFGTKSQTVSYEAAILARESGRPVKISYSREEEFSISTVRPAAVMEINAGIDSDGKLMVWDYTAFHAGDNPFRGRRGADSPYDSEAVRIRIADSPSPLPHGSYRSLGGATNHFGREVHIDTIARELGLDPLEFRLNNLSNQRYRSVLETVAEMSGWDSRTKNVGLGFGVAVGFDAGSYVAQVAKVEVNGRNVSVERVDVAFDCGKVLNPEGARNQVEGAVVMGMGTTLWESVQFEGGRVINTGFGSYRVPRITDVPEINVSFVDGLSNHPTGVGEPGIVPIAAAITNAVVDATGLLIDRLPLQEQL